MKKVFSILLIVSVMSLVLGGCAKEEAADNAAAPAASAPAEGG
jgi:PBP1b-binding outer membrane lipoprotein LpoB